jgi:hypothetical protein
MVPMTEIASSRKIGLGLRKLGFKCGCVTSEELMAKELSCHALVTPGVVKIICEVHPWMSAYIVVTDHPYYSVTDVYGEYLFGAFCRDTLQRDHHIRSRLSGRSNRSFDDSAFKSRRPSPPPVSLRCPT